MLCGKCGKEMSSTEKFCPHCGAANPNAAGKTKPAVPAAIPGQLAGKSLFRIALIVLGALHVLFFFFMSYGKLGDSIARQFASQLGVKMASSLTAPNAIHFYGKLAEFDFPNAEANYYTLILFFGLPLAMGALVLVLNLLNNTKKSYTLSIVFTVLTLLGYLCVHSTMPIFEEMYFSLNKNIILADVLTVAQLVIAIVGRAKDKTIAG